MRADRLLSLLMLLQTRGRLTARQLAAELEVSERTIYRDIEALSSAGVPVYAERGPGGGCCLLESYRTSLTGMNEAELQALQLLMEFARQIPAPLAELGVSQALKAALLKVSAAIPSTRREKGERYRDRLHLDSTPWSGTVENSPHLHLVHQAVMQDRRLRLIYRPVLTTSIELVVEPYGLVSKAGEWLLVAALRGTLRVYPLKDLLQVTLLEERFDRPAGFDLAAFWEQWRAAHRPTGPGYLVRVRVDPALEPQLARFFGENLLRRECEEAQGGWLRLCLSFDSLYAARSRLLGFGRAVEVLEPEALRKSLVDFARQMVSAYQAWDEEREGTA